MSKTPNDKVYFGESVKSAGVDIDAAHKCDLGIGNEKSSSVSRKPPRVALPELKRQVTTLQNTLEEYIEQLEIELSNAKRLLLAVELAA